VNRKKVIDQENETKRIQKE